MGLASIPLMLNAVLMRVAFPAYSRLQNDPEALGRYVKASTRRLGSILWTIIALLIIVLPVGIPLVYGDKWIPAANLLQWLVADAVLQAMICNIASVQNATGRPIERVWITLGIGLFRWGMVVFVAPTFGLVWLGLLISFVPNFIELSITAFMVERRNAGCRGLYREILTPLFCTGVVLGVAFWAGSLLAPASAWLQIGIALGVFVVLSAAREYLTPLRIIRPEIPALLALLRRKSS
jgi:PST family polysaccharide transporter